MALIDALVRLSLPYTIGGNLAKRNPTAWSNANSSQRLGHARDDALFKTSAIIYYTYGVTVKISSVIFTKYFITYIFFTILYTKHNNYMKEN